MQVLALDTSAYTTSLALVNEREHLDWEGRRVLEVERGRLGLRQSEAVFGHLKNIPLLWEEGSKHLEGSNLAAVAVSNRPRPVAGSYMPVFRVGHAFGIFMAQTMGLQLLATSHQEGHVMAALWSAGLPPGCYLAAHLSGGTTELLSVIEDPPGHLKIGIIGGSTDLHAGQFVDRIGVALGAGFPAGKMMEKLAAGGSSGTLRLPVAVTGTNISFSGPASQAERHLQRGCPPGELARAVEICIADSLVLALEAASAMAPFEGVVLVGGVASNNFIRKRLEERFQELPLSFAGPGYSEDNAAGVAVQAARKLSSS